MIAQQLPQSAGRAANDALAEAPTNPVVSLRFCGLDGLTRRPAEVLRALPDGRLVVRMRDTLALRVAHTNSIDRGLTA